MVVRDVAEELLHLMVDGGKKSSSHHSGQESEWSSNRKSPGQFIVLKDTPQVIYFLQIGHTFYSFTTSQ
jgi:hypothetical protein